MVTAHGVLVVVDPRSAPLVQGSTLGFSDALLGRRAQGSEPERRPRVRMRRLVLGLI